MRALALALAASCAAMLSGCASHVGLVYTHTREPLSVDFDRTPVVTEGAAGDVKEIQYYVRVLWSSNAIGEVAKQHGFERVYYADLERLSVLGIWRQEWVHVYGTRKAAPAAAP